MRFNRRERSGRRRLLTWVGVPGGLALGGIGLVLGEIRYARSRTYAKDPRFRIDQLIPGDGPVIELGVVGDSTVAGVGVDTVEDTLPMHIARDLADSTGRPVRVRAWGVSGARTRDVHEKQLGKVPAGLDVLIVEVGSNDVVKSTKLDELDRSTAQLLRSARELAPVVVLGSAGRLDTPNFKQPLRLIMTTRAYRVRKLQRAVAAREGVGFVDIGGRVGDTFNVTRHHISDDGFHPAGPGYAVWARAIAAKATLLLADLPVAEASA